MNRKIFRCLFVVWGFVWAGLIILNALTMWKPYMGWMLLFCGIAISCFAIQEHWKD